MKYNIRFSIEKREIDTNGKKLLDNDFYPIRMAVTWNNKRVFISTGKKCRIKQWKVKEQTITQNATLLNDESTYDFKHHLDILKSIVVDIFDFYNLSKIDPSIQQFRGNFKRKLANKTIVIDGEFEKIQLSSFFQTFEFVYLRYALISEARKDHIRGTMKKLKKFNPDTTFEMIDYGYLEKFYNYLKVDVSINTCHAHLSRFRAFLNYAIKKNWTSNYPFKDFKIPKPIYGLPVYLTKQERDQLYEAQVNEPHLAKVRDMFVFQSMIGCRVQDLKTLKRSNVIGENIEYIAQKTKDEDAITINVPLTVKALKLIEKYNLKNGDLFPYISDVKYNKYLKDLLKKLEINRMVIVLDPKTRMNVQKPISDYVSTHMARRNFIGSLINTNTNLPTVTSMSGHAVTSKEIARYYVIDKGIQKKAIDSIE